MTVFYLNPSYNEVCYKETAMYTYLPDAHFFSCVQVKLICSKNHFETL